VAPFETEARGQSFGRGRAEEAVALRRAKGGKWGESDPGRASLEDEEGTAMDTAMAANWECRDGIGSKTQELQSCRAGSN